jgi:hypothetical protein
MVKKALVGLVATCVLSTLSPTAAMTAMTSGGKDGGPDVHPYGHEAPGFGYNVNQDCCMTSWWDAAQWQIRSFADPLSPSDLISPVMTPKETYMADHTSWNNAQPNTLVPVISATYRFGDNTHRGAHGTKRFWQSRPRRRLASGQPSGGSHIIAAC